MVNVGRAFRLICRSTGDFSGAVIWMKAEEDVTSIGLYLIHYSVHQNYYAFFPFLIHSDAVNNHTITIEDLEMLYVLQVSENEAVLVTIDGFGITRASSGPYTCMATNNLTQARMTITIDVLGNSQNSKFMGRISESVFFPSLDPRQAPTILQVSDSSFLRFSVTSDDKDQLQTSIRAADRNVLFHYINTLVSIG